MKDSDHSPQSSSIWVVIPAHNEEKYIETVLQKVSTYTSNVIVIDDGSSDETSLKAAHHAAHVLTHPVNMGKGAALKTGCEFAFENLQASAVIIMDADDQHDPALLPTFFKALEGGAQVVTGVRDLSTMPKFRTLGNTVASWLVFALFGKLLRDIPSGYKAFSKEAYEIIKWQSLGYSVEMEIAARTAKAKLTVQEIPIPTIYHDFNRGMTMLDVLGMITQLLSWKISL